MATLEVLKARGLDANEAADSDRSKASLSDPSVHLGSSGGKVVGDFLDRQKPGFVWPHNQAHRIAGRQFTSPAAKKFLAAILGIALDRTYQSQKTVPVLLEVAPNVSTCAKQHMYIREVAWPARQVTYWRPTGRGAHDPLAFAASRSRKRYA
jgi:hypothetical protein